MEREEMENIVRLFTEIQECRDKRAAFLKGVLFGLGFAGQPEPNWEVIKNIVKEGDDLDYWIEKECVDIYKKVKLEQIRLVESMLKEPAIKSRILI